MTNEASDSFYDIIKYSKNIQDILMTQIWLRTSHNDEIWLIRSHNKELTHDDTPIMQLKLHYDSFSSTMTHLAPLWLMVTYDDSDWLRMTHIYFF